MEFSEARDWLFKTLGPGVGGFLCFLFKDLTLNVKQLNDRISDIIVRLDHMDADLKSLRKYLKKDDKKC